MKSTVLYNFALKLYKTEYFKNFFERKTYVLTTNNLPLSFYYTHVCSSL